MSYQPLDLLQEVSFGAWEGLEYAEISRRWPKEMDDFLTRPGEWIPPQGESFHDVARRCQAAFDYIFEREGHEKISQLYRMVVLSACSCACFWTYR